MKIPLPSKEEITAAKLIAIVMRNALEDFHVQHLTDAQMKELNPILRDAALTSVYMLKHSYRSKRMQSVMGWSFACIPDYWEEPKLLKDYTNALTGERLFGNPPVTIG